MEQELAVTRWAQRSSCQAQRIAVRIAVVAQEARSRHTQGVSGDHFMWSSRAAGSSLTGAMSIATVAESKPPWPSPIS